MLTLVVKDDEGGSEPAAKKLKTAPTPAVTATASSNWLCYRIYPFSVVIIETVLETKFWNSSYWDIS